MNDDGQFRATHLILDYEPISRTFLDVGNFIRANDYRLARIDVSRPGFLTSHDLPPVDHPIPQGIPLAAQPLQQVPLGHVVAEEGAASSSSVDKEIDKFRFFEKEAIVILEAEEEADEYSCVQTPALIITYMEDSSDNGSKNWPKFEGTYEGKEQGAFSPRNKQVQASSESSSSPSSASC